MAHTRGGGVGNMAGSDDRSLADLVAELRQGIMLGGGYADITEDELERLITATIYPCWQPIETAPVPAWDSPEARPSYFSWPCMLQTQGLAVFSGAAYYVAAPRSTERRILRWRDGAGRQCHPKYWMALPAPMVTP